jgi:hypothetical protein
MEKQNLSLDLDKIPKNEEQKEPTNLEQRPVDIVIVDLNNREIK